jgi:hypothetical protein
VAHALAGKFQKSRRIVSRRKEAMKRTALRSAESRPSIIFQSDNVEQRRRSPLSLQEIRQRAFEIYMERGGIHGCELDDWLQAERELRER